MPVCVIPATISNNVPGTDMSLGSDTGLNTVVEVRAASTPGAVCETVSPVLKVSRTPCSVSL